MKNRLGSREGMTLQTIQMAKGAKKLIEEDITAALTTAPYLCYGAVVHNGCE